MEQDYKDTTIRFKKMKQKTLAISVEKIIEKKRRYLYDVKSSLLPLISQSVKNQNPIEKELFPGSRNHRYTDLALFTEQRGQRNQTEIGGSIPIMRKAGLA